VPPEDPPFIEFDWLGRPDGYGYTGCDAFGFEATIQGDQMSVGDLMRPPGSCGGPKGQVEELFLGDGRLALKRLLEAVTMGRPGPDGTIVLSGPAGEVVLGR
jgi:hypothetical protein